MILEGDKIIAEFMKHQINFEFNKTCILFLGERINKNKLLYHSDWNWLMPVVEKIESIHDENHGYFGVYINSNTCVIQGTNLWKNRENVYISDPNAIFPTKLESTYYNVISFIKWFNENLKK